MISNTSLQALNSNDILDERRVIWKSKKILRYLYTKWYGFIAGMLRPGNVLELGGGSGHSKTFLPYAIRSDILFVPWLDAILDAHELPFKNESLDNIVLFDVLHHLSAPNLFFYEACRVLRPKGRIVMMEPYVSWASFLVYNFFHSEGLDWSINPFNPDLKRIKKNPFVGNQAIPTIIFEKRIKKFEKDFHHLKIIRKEKMDTLIYPLSGGFHNPSFCPMPLRKALLRIEEILRPLNKYLAFRFFIVLEKD